MDSNHKLLEEKFKDWIILNSDCLPITAPFWDIKVGETKTSHQEETYPELLQLGKYEAEIIRSTPFYKPFSKIFKI